MCAGLRLLGVVDGVQASRRSDGAVVCHQRPDFDLNLKGKYANEIRPHFERESGWTDCPVGRSRAREGPSNRFGPSRSTAREGHFSCWRCSCRSARASAVSRQHGAGASEWQQPSRRGAHCDRRTFRR
ncbi:protein of unknown function [Pseudomonas inefficax]|uniref:Uncharacterized protein n=1 Tax=Pseudomonas inefficax TaxID=2078786 RepID=A0AAQ1PAD8_9PSED|nr:protein of unknown function [Pseudomonas inefficax]